MRIVGWMPLKEHSTRLPGKNWRNLGGKPLWQHMTAAMLEVCDEVYINSERELYAWSDRLTIISRKAKHREPTLSPVQMLVDDLDAMNADIIVYTHATIPLLRPNTLRAAVQSFRDSYPRYDSVVSVTRMHERFYNHAGHPINFKRDQVIPLQDTPPVYLENSAFFILRSDDMRRMQRRVGDRPYMCEIPDDEAVEIDDEQDFQYAEWLHERKHETVGEVAYNQVTDKTIFDHVMQAGRMYD